MFTMEASRHEVLFNLAYVLKLDTETEKVPTGHHSWMGTDICGQITYFLNRSNRPNVKFFWRHVSSASLDALPLMLTSSAGLWLTSMLRELVPGGHYLHTGRKPPPTESNLSSLSWSNTVLFPLTSMSAWVSPVMPKMPHTENKCIMLGV